MNFTILTGLAIALRGADFARTRALHRMPHVLVYGKVEEHPNPSKRLIRYGSEIAIIQNGRQGRWEIVTSYDENKNSHRDDLGISTTTEEERKARK